MILKHILLVIVSIGFFLIVSCNGKQEGNNKEELLGINRELQTLLDKAMLAREEGHKDDAILLFKKCIEVPENGSDSLTMTLVSNAMIELYNTYQWAERWHEGAEWFYNLYKNPTPFIAQNCRRDLSVFTAMGLSRDNKDSIAEVIIEDALRMPARNYTPWKYYRDYAYASAILYTNLAKTDQNIRYAENAIKYAELSESQAEIRKPIGKSYVISMLGNLYQRSGRLKEGSDLIRQSISSAIVQKDTLAQINGYNDLTKMMLYWDITTQANEYSRQAMSLLKEYSGLVKDPLVVAIAYAYRGRVMAAQKSDSVMYFWHKAEEISSKMPYDFGMDDLDLLISEYYMDVRDSISSVKRRLMRVVEGAAKENVAKAYHLLAKIAKEEDDEKAAVMYADSMYVANMSAHRKLPIPGGNAFGLALALENGDNDKVKMFSRAFLNEYAANTDPLNTRQLTEIVARHYLSEKNTEVAMEKEKMKNRFLILTIILAASILLTIFVILSMLYRSRLAKAQQLLLEERLDSLLSSNSIIKEKLESELKKNSEMQGRLDLLVSDDINRQKIGADAISRVKTSDGLSDFLVRFNMLYPSFISNLRNKVPDIGKREQLLCMLMALGCDSEQISNLMNVAPKSVNMARWRLRKKFGLTSDQSLDDLIKSLAEESTPR